MFDGGDEFLEEVATVCYRGGEALQGGVRGVKQAKGSLTVFVDPCS